jgi:hypothetical protein
VRADADSDFPVKPFQEIKQLVRGKAAKMAVHHMETWCMAQRIEKFPGGDLAIAAEPKDGRNSANGAKRGSHAHEDPPAVGACWCPLYLRGTGGRPLFGSPSG